MFDVYVFRNGFDNEVYIFDGFGNVGEKVDVCKGVVGLLGVYF